MRKIISILIPVFLFAGWHVEEMERVETKDTTLSMRNHIYFDENHVKVTGDRGTFIIDLTDSLIYMVNEKRRVYTTLRLTDWLRTVYEIESAMAVDSGGTIRIEKGNEEEKIAGYSAVKYTIYVDGQPFEELWISPEFRLKELEKLEGLLEEISPSRIRLLRNRIRRKLKEMTPGWPLKTVTLGEGEKYTTVILKIEELNLEPSAFKPESSFREVDPNEFFRQFQQ